MRIDYLILADAVAVAEGKHYIHGGGWDTLFVGAFPAVHPTLGIAVRLLIAWEEMNQPHTVEIDVLDSEDGTSILPGPPLQGPFYISRSPNTAPGSDQSVHLALDLANLRFERPGAYTVVFRVDGGDLARPTFHVIAPPQPSE